MQRTVIAIDGNCGSGKTTLSEMLKQQFDCNVFHMDDFYLPLSKRKEDWEYLPAGNMDLDRLKREVLTPNIAEEVILYRPYFCRTDRMGATMYVKTKALTVIEGSYSHHPLLDKWYHLKIFLTCSKEEQRRRLMQREKDRFPFYENRWIPMEERYYAAFHIPDRADKIFDTKEYDIYEEIIRYIKAFLNIGKCFDSGKIFTENNPGNAGI